MEAGKQTHPIIVIGAGIVGASIAYNLASRGAAVTVVEAGEPGHGASAVSFAWINAREKNPRHYHDLNRRSVDMWDRFARQLGNNVGLTWGGELRWTATPAGAEALLNRVTTLQSWGYPIYLLDEAMVKLLEPNLNFDQLTAASFTRIDGHVDVTKVIAACLDRAAESGAVHYSKSRVTGLKLSPSANGTKEVEAVYMDGQPLPCTAVVQAGGPDAPELAAMAGIDLPLENTFGATIVTDPLPPLFNQVAVVHTPPDKVPQIVLRQLPDGAVMIHGGDAGTTTGSLGSDETEISEVLAAAKNYMPALQAADIVEIRRGRRPVPQDGRSILGFTRSIPNLYLASTHSGVTLAPLIGEFAATEILDGTLIDLLEPYRLERF